MIRRTPTILQAVFVASVFTLWGCGTTIPRSYPPESAPASSSKPEKPPATLVQAAAQGDPQGQFQLAETYAKRGNIGLALESYGKAAEGGHREAQYTLGLMYDLGIDVDGDITEAMKWYRLAAKQEHRDAYERLCQLAELEGDCGRLVEEIAQERTEDIRRTVAKLTQAAEQGDLEAQYALGKLGADALGLPDPRETERWWREAATGGHAEAQYQLAELYRRGLPVTQDLPEAKRWYQRAIRSGHPEAERGLPNTT